MHDVPGNAPQPCSSKTTTASTLQRELTQNSSSKRGLADSNTEIGKHTQLRAVTDKSFGDAREQVMLQKWPDLQILHFRSKTCEELTLSESGREVPAPCRALSGSQGGKVTLMGGMSVKLPQETGLQGAGKTSAGHRHLAPGEPLTSGKTLHSFVPNRQAGHSSSVPESNKQSSFKMLTYALFFLEKKAQNKRGGFA